jgi:hypothetical protein
MRFNWNPLYEQIEKQYSRKALPIQKEWSGLSNWSIQQNLHLQNHPLCHRHITRFQLVEINSTGNLLSCIAGALPG